MSRHRAARGYTILQLLFAMMIIGFLIALALPGLQQSRCGCSRRTECSNKMRQLGLALLNYEDKFKTLPPAAIFPTRSDRPGSLGPADFRDPRWGPTAYVLLLPFLEGMGTYHVYDFDHDPTAEAKNNSGNIDSPLAHEIDSLICPSSERVPPAHGPNDLRGIYAKGNLALNCGADFANHDYDNIAEHRRGPFSLYPPFGAKLSQVIDGTANTIAVSEILIFEDDNDGRGCWGRVGGAIFSGHTFRTGADIFFDGQICTPNISAVDKNGDLLDTADRPIHCADRARGELRCEDQFNFDRGGVVARSRHCGGVNAGMLDASVNWVSNEVDPFVWIHALTIAGGEVPGDLWSSGLPRSRAVANRHKTRPVKNPAPTVASAIPLPPSFD